MRTQTLLALAGGLALLASAAPSPGSSTAWSFSLPTDFVALGADGFHEGFESGVLPSAAAVTAVDAATGLPDVDAWCTIGTGIFSTVPYDGTYDFELGFDPGSAHAWHDVRNALVIGFDGAGHPGPFELSMRWRNLGEDAQAVDGVWLSDDGVAWFQVSGVDGLGTSGLGWTDWTDGSSGWGLLTFDLAAAAAADGLDLFGPFYVAIAEEDNLPLGFEGILVDEVKLDHVPGGGPALAVTNLVAGQTATLDVTNLGASDQVLIAFSLTGGGPLASPVGTVFLSPPQLFLPLLTADGSGAVTLSQPVPAGTAGIPMWFQAYDLTSGLLSAGVATAIQ